MVNSISRLTETTKQSTIFRRYKANQSVAASIGLIVMVFFYSKLMAENTLSTTVEERFIEDKSSKSFGFLDHLISHNAYMGSVTPFALNPNSTHLIFAMNNENERGKKKDELSKESEGAGAPQPRPLMEIPLPPMTRANVSAIIRGLNTGIDEVALNTMLSYIPKRLPNESLTINSMLRKLIRTLGIVFDDNQMMIKIVLSSIQGTTTPVDMTKPQQQQSLAILMLAYYTAINSNGISPEIAHVFFNSFLLHATGLSGIGKLYAKKGVLLGTNAPIEDNEVLRANIKKSATVFSGLVALERTRLKFLRQMENHREAEETGASANPLQIATFSLLNYDVNKNEIPFYLSNIKSAQRMLRLIKEYGEKKPELVAANDQFMRLIHIISLTLNPSVARLASPHVNNISNYFRQSNWDQTITDSKGKEQKLFEIFKEVVFDANVNSGNENPALFRKLLLGLEKYIEQQLQKTFIDPDYQAIMVTLSTGFENLLKQSHIILATLKSTFDTDTSEQVDGAKLDKAAKGKELSKEEKKKKEYLEQRIKYLEDFVELLRSQYGFSLKKPNDSDNSDSE